MTRRSEGASARVAAFDLDGTLLEGRVIFEVARQLGLTADVERAMKSTALPYQKSQRIARLLRGAPMPDITKTVEAIPLSEGAVEAVEWLKDSNYKVGIISDGYTLATGLVARKLGLDFDIANTLRQREGVATGGITMPLGWEKIGCECRGSVCKRYALSRMAERYGAGPTETIAVGDSAADLCMLTSAGLGIWYSRGRVTERPTDGEGVVPISDMRALPSCVQARSRL